MTVSACAKLESPKTFHKVFRVVLLVALLAGGTFVAINEAKLKVFLEKAIGDVGAAMSAVLVLIGDQLGLYKAMAHAGPLTPAELAARTGTAERYLREWLANQAAG